MSKQKVVTTTASEEPPLKVGTVLFIGICFLCSAVGLISLPLILSTIEHLVFDSMFVEDFFRDLGLHDELGLIYEPVMDLLYKLLSVF